MELLEGQSLRERIASQKVGAAELLDLARQICDGLQAAHAKGIVHRDIKPANIFITTLGQIKILDFGLAKLVAEPSPAPTTTATLGETVTATTITRPGSVTGTLAYMSPEQARGEEVDARSDLFSLGAVMYEMATGQKPFHGITAAELIGSILREMPAKPSALNPKTFAGLERIIPEGTRKRPASAVSIGRGSTGGLEEIASTRKRRRVQVAAAALAALLLGGAITTSVSVRISHIRWARNEALPRARLLAETNAVDGALAVLR